MKKIITLSLLFLCIQVVQGQKYFTKKGKITFYSKTKVEDIEANNNRVTSVLDSESGKIEFAVLITAFEFEKALMQEHFNENYMESTKYPKAIFKGSIDDIKTVKLDKDGSYPVTITGDMTMHGVTKKITEKGTIKVNSGKISATCDFKVLLKDYKIKIPSAVGQNIAEEIAVKVTIPEYEPLKK